MTINSSYLQKILRPTLLVFFIIFFTKRLEYDIFFTELFSSDWKWFLNAWPRYIVDYNNSIDIITLFLFWGWNIIRLLQQIQNAGQGGWRK